MAIYIKFKIFEYYHAWAHPLLTLKTGVNTHPKHGEIILNDAYLSFAEHYQIAIMPTGVKKLTYNPL
jgi:hypothetical protein